MIFKTGLSVRPVDGLPATVLPVREEVRVPVQGHGHVGVAEPLRDGADVLAVRDQQRGVAVPERVRAGTGRRSDGADGGPPSGVHETGVPGWPFLRREDPPLLPRRVLLDHAAVATLCCAS